MCQNWLTATVDVNIAPVAHDNVYGVGRGGSVTITADEGLLYNDFDPGTLTTTLISDGTEGTVSLNSDGTFTYVHGGGAANSDSFTYEASNGSETWTATVVINVDDEGFVSTDEFLVNQEEPNSPISERQDTHRQDGRFSDSAVATAANGDYAVTWTGYNGVGDEVVFVRSFDYSGQPLGDAVEVSSQLAVGDNHAASIAMAGDGSFVVVWSNEASPVSVDGSPSSAYFQRFNADGTLDGLTQAVATSPTFYNGAQYRPDIAINDSGVFAISWDGAGDGSTHDIFVNVFDNTGASLSGGPIEINDVSPGFEYDSYVTVGNDGKVIVTWDDTDGVHGKILTPHGDGSYSIANASSEFATPQLSNVVSVENASIDISSDSNYLAVAYEVEYATGGDGTEIRLQVFDISNPVAVLPSIGSQTITGDQLNPSVSFGEDNVLVMTWDGNGTGDNEGIFGRKFQVESTSSGNPYVQAIGDEFLVNQYTSGTQEGASVSAIDGSNFVVVWSGEGSEDSLGVYARQFGNQSGYNVSGAVLEDVDGNSQLDDGVGFVGATVYLYRDNGDGVAGAGDVKIGQATTGVGGEYVFEDVKGDRDYWVVVDSKLLTGSEDTWAEQTYGNGGVLVGGLNAGVSDDASSLATSQHVSGVSLGDSNYTDVDFGFSYNVVSNVGGGDNSDHDLEYSGKRSVQGSLRQFITNGNEIAGENHMRFVPGVAVTETDGSNGWWEIAISEELPEITDAYTIIDGRAYDNSDTTFDPGDGLDPSRRKETTLHHGSATSTDGPDGIANTGDESIVIGTGVDGVARSGDEVELFSLDALELEIYDVLGVTNGLTVNASNVEIGYIAIHGFGDGSGQDDANIFVKSGGDDAWIHHNMVGTTADSFSPATTRLFSEFGIIVQEADGGTIEDNLIGFQGYGGILLQGDSGGADLATSWTIASNEVRGNGVRSSVDWSGITLSQVDSINVQGNLVAGNAGYGIDVLTSFWQCSYPGQHDCWQRRGRR